MDIKNVMGADVPWLDYPTSNAISSSSLLTNMYKYTCSPITIMLTVHIIKHYNVSNTISCRQK